MTLCASAVAAVDLDWTGDYACPPADRGGPAEAEKRMMQGQTICVWCAAPVTLRRGGSPRKFCCARCRHEFHSRARRWAEAAIAAGALSVDVLKNRDPAACTLLQGTISPTPENQSLDQYPTPVAPRAETPYTSHQQLEVAMARAVAMRRR